MIYLKSILAGVGALVLTVLLLPIGSIIYGFGALLFRRLPGTYDANAARAVGLTPHTGGSAEVAWDLRSIFANSVIPWIIVLAIFGLGFYWEFRRASR